MCASLPVFLPVHSPNNFAGDDFIADDVVKYITDVQHLWYEIGVALSIPTAILDTISQGDGDILSKFKAS